MNCGRDDRPKTRGDFVGAELNRKWAARERPIVTEICADRFALLRVFVSSWSVFSIQGQFLRKKVRGRVCAAVLASGSSAIRGSFWIMHSIPSASIFVFKSKPKRG